MIALGIDPGLAHTGWALVESQARSYRLVACGAVTSPPGPSPEVRLETLCDRLLGALKERGARPDCTAIEAVEVRRQAGQKINPAGLLLTALVAGAVWALSSQTRRSSLVRASDWRRAIGAGHGSDAEVRAAVERVVGPVRGNAHSRDAIGIALWALRNQEVTR